MAITTHNNGSRRPFTTQIVARGLYAEATLTGAVTLTPLSGQLLKLDPGGANRNVTLPAVEDGLVFWIVNAADAAENLVVENAAGTTIGTINQNEEGVFVSDGAAWKLFRIATIALS